MKLRTKKDIVYFKPSMVRKKHVTDKMREEYCYKILKGRPYVEEDWVTILANRPRARWEQGNELKYDILYRHKVETKGDGRGKGFAWF